MPGVTLELPPDLLAEIAAAVAERIGAGSAEPYLDVDAAAAYLAAPKSRIYDLVEAGRLKHYRDGRRLIFQTADLDAVLERR